jgi:cystathionine beta-lyase/cystathionine gamma-synthase
MDADRPLGSSRPIAPPLYTSSVYAIPDLEVLDRITEFKEPGYIYARDRHPNATQLAIELNRLECANWCVTTASGMGALAATLLAFVKQGDRIVASDQLYGRTIQILGQELSRLGVVTEFVDVSDLAKVKAAFDQPAKVLLVEVISNPLLRLADVPSLGEIAREHDCALVVDNTFATPVLFQPLNHGATVAMESLTKMIGGHSDLTLGAVMGREPDLGKRIALMRTIWGMSPSPFDCWMAMRSLTTVELRVKAAAANAARIADWLNDHSGLSRVIYPGLRNHPDHELTQRLINGPPGNIVTFEVPGGREAVNKFMLQAKGIPFSPSLGDTRTTCSYPAGTSHRYVEADEKRRLGITDGLIRLSVGIEPVEETCREIEKGLEL